MRVLFSSSRPLIQYGLATGFEDNGHATRCLNLDGLSPAEQRVVLEGSIAEFAPDFVMAEGYSLDLELKLFFGVLRNTGVPLVYWAIEDPLLCRSVSTIYAREAVLTLTPAEECLPYYRSQGFSAALLRFGCNPRFHRPRRPAADLAHDIVLVANNYDNRSRQVPVVVQPLIDEGYDIKVWGRFWDDEERAVQLPDNVLGGELPYELLPHAYSSARIALGLHTVEDSPTQTSMRTYEVLGCRALYLTHYTRAHEHLFENGTHLVWSCSPEDTLQLVQRYLSDDEARAAVARRGQRLVYRRDQYTMRARKVSALVTQLVS
jgi:spore maturation protein CgeB